jgi:SAM-dependent methyltransferase
MSSSAWDVTDGESLLGFSQMGLDRVIPGWVPFDPDYPILNLGPGNKIVDGTVALDWPDWDADLEPIPYDDNNIGGIIATHFLEHLNDPRPAIREAGRVLRSGCPFNILVPHGQSLSYLQDLDHNTPFVIDTWKNLLENPYYDKGREEPFQFRIGANFLFGVKESNLALVTQLIKV